MPACYRTLRVFYNWLYYPRSGYALNPALNPIIAVEPSKVDKRILPAFSVDEVEHLLAQSESTRDKAIISLFVDSGLMLSELTNIKPDDIYWQNCLIKVKCKGGKEAYAPFGQRTKQLLQ